MSLTRDAAYPKVLLAEVAGAEADRRSKLPPRTRIGDNLAAFLGGIRLCDKPAESAKICRENP